MKHVILGAALAGVLGVSGAAAQSAAPALGTVTISRKVMADGKALAPGTYRVRLTSESPQPAVGLSPEGERYVEFLKAGKVVGREVAVVVPGSEIGEIAKGKRPAAGAARVELLKGNEYVRVWINKAGTHYIINLPTGA